MIIKLPNGKTAEFPDEMPLDQIKSILRNKFPAPNGNQSQQPGFLERNANFADQYINQPIERLGRTARNLAGGFGQGIANIVPGLYNLGASGVNALGGNLPKSPMFNFSPPGAATNAGEILSFFSGPSALKALGTIPELSHTANSAMKIPVIAEGIKHASNILSKSPTLSRVAGNAILGGAYSPDNQLLGMGLGGASPLIGKGIERAYNALRPSKMLRGNLSPEELLDNLRITQGTETGLGDVIGNPMLKRLNENVLSKIPFSGVNESMQKNAGEIINRGHSLIDQLAGKSDIENLDKYLNDALKSSYKSHQGEKNAHYANVNKLAEETGLHLDLPKFAEKVGKHKNAIEDTNILKYEPEMQALLRKLGRYESPVKSETTVGKIVNERGEPLLKETKFTNPTLEEANLLKGKLNQLANKHGASISPSDRHLSGVFGDLARTLKGDIEGAIENSGNKELKDAYKAAEENYAKKFSPFLDKKIYKFINGNADPETLIQSFVKTGKSSDRANLTKKVTEKLPLEDRNLLGYGYLQRAMDENNVLNPLKLKTLLSKNSLGNKQFEALFPNPVLRNELRDYISLIDKNTKGLKLMQNPETGQMNMDILPLISKSPMSLGAKMLGAPLLAKALRSEKTKENIINKMVNERNRK